MYNISRDSNMCLIISIGRKTNLKSIPISNPLHGLPMRAFPVRWCRLVYQLYFQAKRWRIRKSLDGTQERTEKTTTVRNVFWACEKKIPKKQMGAPIWNLLVNTEMAFESLWSHSTISSFYTFNVIRHCDLDQKSIALRSLWFMLGSQRCRTLTGRVL